MSNFVFTPATGEVRMVDDAASDAQPQERNSHEYAVCPHCKEEHGDCWDWLTSQEPITTTCDACGKPFLAWVQLDVTYKTAPLKAPAAP